MGHNQSLRPVNFYPRSPCGERLRAGLVRYSVGQFLSTLSLRRATCPRTRVDHARQFLSTLSLRRATLLMNHSYIQYHISIHALLAESDFQILGTVSATKNFYPRSPCGERLYANGCTYRKSLISIHALLAESDLLFAALFLRGNYISIHALLAESDNSPSPIP